MQTQFTDTSVDWVFTGSSVSGDGYGYAIYRNALGAYGVRLSFRGYAVTVPVDSYNAARDKGERFADAWRAWRVVESRARALANGIAVIGGAR